MTRYYDAYLRRERGALVDKVADEWAAGWGCNCGQTIDTEDLLKVRAAIDEVIAYDQSFTKPPPPEIDWSDGLKSALGRLVKHRNMFDAALLKANAETRIGRYAIDYCNGLQVKIEADLHALISACHYENTGHEIDWSDLDLKDILHRLVKHCNELEAHSPGAEFGARSAKPSDLNMLAVQIEDDLHELNSAYHENAERAAILTAIKAEEFDADPAELHELRKHYPDILGVDEDSDEDLP